MTRNPNADQRAADNMMKITTWTHPSTDQKLILSGSIDETRSDALAYFSYDSETPSGAEGEMDEGEFSRLAEFEG